MHRPSCETSQELCGEAAFYGPQGAILSKCESKKDQLTTYGRYFVNEAATVGYGVKEEQQV